MEINKQKIRQNILNQRQTLSHQQWQINSQQICDRLSEISLFNQAQTVLAYFSFRQEPDLSFLFDFPVKWGFPRCVGRSLMWHLWQPGEALQAGKYGILEPLTTAAIIQPQEVDLIVVPAVACDQQGYRLGYGGGFYDRLLNSPEWSHIPTIGVVFDFAYLTQLPVDSWDIKLNYVCTENTSYHTKIIN